MADIPHELMVEILSRLPAESLLRFKCLSKPWYHLISQDDDFIKLHLTHAIERDDVALLLRNIDNNLEKWMDYCFCNGDSDELSGVLIGHFSESHFYCIDTHSSQTHFNIRSPFDPSSGYIDISFNLRYTHDDLYDLEAGKEGILDLEYNAYDEHGNEIDSRKAYTFFKLGDYGLNVNYEGLLNINDDTTRVVGSCNGIVCLIRAEKVCLLNPCTREYKIVSFEKGFDADAAYGFGYDFICDDFKIVQLVDLAKCSSKLNVYSSNDSSCSTTSIVPYGLPRVNELGVFIKRAMHWLAMQEHTPYVSIISYDIEENKLREVPLPDVDVRAEEACMSVGILEGKLCIACGCKYDVTGIDVWVHRIYGVRDSWFKMFTVDTLFLKMTNKSWRSKPLLMPLCAGKNGEIIFMNYERLVGYDSKKRAMRDLNRCSVSNLPQFHDLVAHVPSLVRLNSGTYQSAW